MTRPELEVLIKESLQQIFEEEVSVAGDQRLHERMKLELLFSRLAEALLNAKQDLLDDKWVRQTNNQKGNFILHKIISVLEEKKYL